MRDEVTEIENLKKVQADFSDSVLDRLEQKAKQGYRGWDDPVECTDAELIYRMKCAIRNKEFVDVAAFAMMLDYRSQP